MHQAPAETPERSGQADEEEDGVDLPPRTPVAGP